MIPLMRGARWTATISLIAGITVVPWVARAEVSAADLEVLKGDSDPRVRIAPMFGLAYRTEHELSFAIGARAAYALSPDFHLELFGTYVLPGEYAPAVINKFSIRQDPELASQTQLLWATGLALWWRPIYGGIAFGEAALGRFRVELGAGIAMGETRVPCTNGLPLDPNRGFPEDDTQGAICNPNDSQSPSGTEPIYYEPSTLRPVGQLAVAFDAVVADVISVRVEVRDLLFVTRVYRPGETPALDDAVAHWVFFQLGAGVVF